MRRGPLSWVWVAVAALGLGGCLDMEKVVRVNPDGSALVEERMLMQRDALALMQGMAKMTSQTGGEGGFQLLDPARLAAEAAAMGPGVTLISAEALSTPQGEGYIARFAVADINQLSLDQNPNQPATEGAAQSGPPGAGAMGGTQDRAAGRPASGPASGPAVGSQPAREAIRFELQKGARPLLVIRSPKADQAGQEGGTAAVAKDPLPEGPEGQMALQMMQQMFKGMHVAVYVEVNGEILETNAGFRDGSRVTLMDIQFDQILADPVRFKRLASAQPEGMEQIKALLKDLPGVKVELNDPVQIRFAPR